MNRLTFVLPIISVSFLAICRVSADEFSDFEKSAAPTQSKTEVVHKVSATDSTKTEPNLSPEQRKEQIAKLKEDLKKNPQQLTTLQKLANAQYKNGEFEAVTILLWKNIEKLSPSELLLLARSHEKRNEADQMIKALNILTSKDAKDYVAYYLLGNAYAIKNKNKETLENYKSCLDINPKFEPAYLGLIKLYEKKRNPYELRMLYQDMIDNIGPRSEYLSKLCEINTNDGTFEVAIGKCNEALAKNPQDINSIVNLGLSQKGTGDNETALKTLKLAANKYTRSEYSQYSYAKILEEQKNYVDALPFYKQALAVDNKSQRAWMGLANCSLELQKFDISLDAFKRACAMDRKNATLFRKAASQLSNSRNLDWSKKFSDAADQCVYGH